MAPWKCNWRVTGGSIGLDCQRLRDSRPWAQ